MGTATFQKPATDRLQSAPPQTLSATDIKTESSSLTVDPGTKLVVYQTLEKLMRTRASKSLRVQVIALWVVVVAGLLYLLQISGYERAMRDIGASQNRSIASLGTAMNAEQSKMGGVTNQLNTLTGDTKRRFSEAEQHFNSEDRTARLLAERISILEKAKPVATTVRVGPLSRLPWQPPDVVGENGVTARIVAASPTNPHQHNVDMNIPLIPGATVHINAMKEPDYWMVIRPAPFGAKRTVHVMPFESSRLGIKVHCIDDGRDYTVTAAGEWL